MKHFSRQSLQAASIALVAGTLVACAARPPASASAPTSELAGRTAGQPTHCIPIVRAEPLRLADPHTVLYGHGRTIWVNRFDGTCGGMRVGDTLIVNTIGSRYCRGNLVRSVDPVSHLPGPACNLGDFVPYTR